MYSIARHPLYLGNYLLWLAPAVATGVWWSPVVATVGYWSVYWPIVRTEEAFLRETFGASYLAWAAVTPAVLPAIFRWRRAALPFSLKTLLRQEYYAFFSAVFLFFVLEVGTAWVESGRPRAGGAWIGGLLGAALVSGVLRGLQRHTRVLDVEGR